MKKDQEVPTKGTVIEHHHEQQQPPYGTFQGVANYPTAPHQGEPVLGLPRPMAPPGAGQSSSMGHYYDHRYQAVPGYTAAEAFPARSRRLPCCGCGIGWFLFIIGWFLAAIPWYVGALVLLCNRRRLDPREKPGYIACTIAAILATIAIIIGATKGADEW